MNNVTSLSHSRWECKYHVVCIPKCWRKSRCGHLRQHLGGVFHDLARQKESLLWEGHFQPEHIHMPMSIPPKCPVAQVIDYMKCMTVILPDLLCSLLNFVLYF